MKPQSPAANRRAVMALAAMADGAPSETLEALAHELAHAVVLKTRLATIDVRGNDARARSAANQHEIMTLAVQHAAMRRLGLPPSITESCVVSVSSMYRTQVVDAWSVAKLRRLVRATRPNKRAVDTFVRIVRTIAEVA